MVTVSLFEPKPNPPFSVSPWLKVQALQTIVGDGECGFENSVEIFVFHERKREIDRVFM